MAPATLSSPVPVQETPIAPEGRIPVANIQPARREFPDDQWLNVPNVPVFAEHETVTAKGRVLTFGRKELAAVAANCNRRIRETGDYAGIVVGHTPDPADAPTAPQKPLVGLAGPFRLGLLQQPGQAPKWAILADYHLQRRYAHVLQDYPRRSPELWVEDRYEEMYLDPIALLGAEAPRLDMGLLYSAYRRQDGREVERYSAAAPAAGNVFVPCEAKTHEAYSAESAAEATPDDSTTTTPVDERTDVMPMTPEDVKQIIDALEQQDWVQWVKGQMKAQTAQDPPAAGDEAQTYAADAGPADPTPPPAPATPPIPAAPGTPPVPQTAPVPPIQPEAGVPPVKYSRLANELDQLRQKMAAVEGQLQQERAQRVSVERYSALAELRRTRLFDLDKEAERCDYSKMTNEQFAAHLDTIEANYREVPIGMAVPTFDLPAAHSPSRPGAKAEREKYSKEVRDRALTIGKQRAMAGENVDYQQILNDVAAGKL